jgi:ABC-type phosphate/phosphonate transport system permease subunit
VAAPATLAQWLPIAAAWLLGSFGCGAALAWLYKRLHPQLAFYKLWAFWSAVLGGIVALVLAFGLVRM